MQPTRVITLFNYKGGVLKTTSAVEIAAQLSLLNKKTLIIDFDGQGNVGLVWGKNTEDYENNTWTALEAFDQSKSLTKFDQAINNVEKNLDVVYANMDMFFAEFYVNSLMYEGKNQDFSLVSRFIDAIKANYDYDFIIIDTAPSNSNLQANILNATDEIIIPSKMETFSGIGIIKVMNMLEQLGDAVNSDLIAKISFILPTIIKSRSKLHSATNDDLKEALKGMERTEKPLILPNALSVPDSVMIANVIDELHKPISIAKPKHKISQIYKNIVETMIINNHKSAFTNRIKKGNK